MILSMNSTEQQITTFPKGRRVGVNRDGKPVGHAVNTGSTWTAFVNIEQPPFDFVQTGFASADEAVAFIAKNGHAS